VYGISFFDTFIFFQLLESFQKSSFNFTATAIRLAPAGVNHHRTTCLLRGQGVGKMKMRELVYWSLTHWVAGSSWIRSMTHALWADWWRTGDPISAGWVVAIGWMHCSGWTSTTAPTLAAPRNHDLAPPFRQFCRPRLFNRLMLRHAFVAWTICTTMYYHFRFKRCRNPPPDIDCCRSDRRSVSY